MNTSLKPDILYFKKQIYIFLTITVIAYIFFIPFYLIVFGGPTLLIGSVKLGSTLILILGHAVWFTLGVIILLFSKLWIDRLSYIIKDSSITIYKGIFTKIEQNIPNTKVTDFILHRDLFDRFIGIGSIKVQTAGASGAVGYEGKLDGVLDYQEVHSNLRDKLISMQTAVESTKNTNESNDSVLTDIQ